MDDISIPVFIDLVGILGMRFWFERAIRGDSYQLIVDHIPLR